MKFHEFQAVVLAGGKGSRMLDLTHDKAKSFLPIGNYPMVWYTLRLLQSIGFQEAIVIVQDGSKDEMMKLPKKYGLDIRVDVATVTSQEDSGTAEALRQVYPRLTAENIMVISADLLVDINQIRHLTDLHRVHRSSLTTLFAPISINPAQVQVPGPKGKHKTEKDLVGIDKSNGQLCFLSAEADLSEFVSLKRSLLWEHPNITMHSNLQDAHFYIFSKAMIDFIYNERELMAIKGEVVPQLVRRQFRQQASANPDSLLDDMTPNAKSSGHPDMDNLSKEDDLQNLIQQAQSLSSWNDHSGDLKGAYRNRSIRCYAFVIDKGTTCIRCNNLVSYCEANRQIGQLWPLLSGEKEMSHAVHPNAKLGPKAVVGPETLVGEDTEICDKTTIKNCIIGTNCKIEEKVRLTDCIIMDRVTVRSGTNVQGSLLCDDVIVEEKVEMKDCIIGKRQIVSSGAKISNEVVIEDDSRMFVI